ncbi:MAG: ComF family protein [Caldilineaceae bacterium]|nr:ComF family protein [Caldilineaceae bacterium]
MMAAIQLWRQRFQGTRAALVDLLFPPQCVACQTYGTWFCARCAQQVEPVGPACGRCGRPQPTAVARCAACREQGNAALAHVYIAALHTAPLREAIHRFKYHHCPELAEPLARYLVALVQALPIPTPLTAVDGVVPVPLHDTRHRERGYNQAELLASAFCRSVQLPLSSAWLFRQRATRSQVGLTATERQQNVQDAFRAMPAVADKRLLLVDDLYTTGATMRACAQAALAAGATSVVGLALACPR